MTQQRDWGSRPIQGRDWGGSVVYDETLMAELNRRFEETCRVDDPTETALLHPFENIPRSSSSLFDDLAIDGIDEVKAFQVDVNDCDDLITQQWGDRGHGVCLSWQCQQEQ